MPEFMISATQKVSFDIPSGWRVLSNFTPKKTPLPDCYQLIVDNIGDPILSKSLGRGLGGMVPECLASRKKALGADRHRRHRP